MNKRLKKIVSLFCAVVVLCCTFSVIFFSCKKKELKEITFVLDWAPNTNHTGVYVAQKLGYYEKEGLKVNVIQPGDTGTSAMVAGGLGQFGVDFQEQMYANYFQDIKATAVAAILQHNTSGILTLKSDNINSPKDLSTGGKKYSTWGLPIEQTIIENLITKDGGTIPEGFYYPDYSTDAISLLDSKKAQSAWIFEGWDKVKADMIDSNKYNYLSLKDLDPALDWYTPVIIGNDKFIKENPELTKKFLKATKKGYEYAIKNPEKAAEILMELNPELKETKDFIIESQKFVSKKYIDGEPKWGYINKDRWENFYKYLNTNKEIINKKFQGTEHPIEVKDIPVNFGYTNEYLK